MKLLRTLALILLAAAPLGGCASDWQERYEQSQRENLDMAQQMEATRTQHAQEAARAEAALAQNSALERENKELLERSNRAATVANEYAMSAQAPHATGPIGEDELSRKVSELQRAGYEVGRAANGDIEITLSSDVTFALGARSSPSPPRSRCAPSPRS